MKKPTNKKPTKGRVLVIDDMVLTENNLEFTLEQKEEHRQLVNSAKRKVKRLSNDDTWGVLLGTKANNEGQYFQSDDYNAIKSFFDKSTSLAQYKTYEEYEKAIKFMKKFNARGYETKRLNDLRENLKKASTESSIRTVMSDNDKKAFFEIIDDFSDVELAQFFSMNRGTNVFDIIYLEDVDTALSKLDELEKTINKVKRG